MAGPLEGVRVVELGAIGPVPLAAMILADLGADVVRIDRLTPIGVISGAGDPTRNVVNRGRRSVQLDVRQPRGRALALDLIRGADVLLEGMRPGTAERLGLGPEDCDAVNPRLIYGRMTGWGQAGPLAQRAGHDINYLALTGALWASGRATEKPVAALNLVGDYGGGTMFLLLGVLSALFERSNSGRGQVIDAAMVDGVGVLTSLFWALRAMGRWSDERGDNPLDTGHPEYEVYECADGRWVAVGALEPAFYETLIRLTGFVEPAGERDDPRTWPERKRRWADLFLTRPRDEWARVTADSDACLTPVLDWDEAGENSHLSARSTYVEVAGVRQPAPAPRLSRTPGYLGRPPGIPGQHTAEVLSELGLSESDLNELRGAGIVN